MKSRRYLYEPFSHPDARPAIQQGDLARLAILRGVATIANALRPTLGPGSGTVMVAREAKATAPELLTRGGLIARRTIEIEDPFENMGAMLLRQLAWQMHERFGDGATTAAVLAHRLLAELVPPVTASVNPQKIRAELDQMLPSLLDALLRMARPIDGRRQLRAALANDARVDDAVEVVAEVLDALGPDATVRVRTGQRTGVTVDYLEGASWSGRCASGALKDDEETSRLIDARVFVTDQTIRSAQDLIPVMDACLASGSRSLLVVAPEIGDAAIGLLAVNRAHGVLQGALAVQPTNVGPHQRDRLDDIAVVSGGRVLAAVTGDRIDRVTPDDLGFARQVWVTASMFGFVNPAGRGDARRARLRRLQRDLATPGLAASERVRLEGRIGNLAGLAAEIQVSAATEAERSAQQERIEAMLALGRAALREGVVPGGGRALLELATRVPCGREQDDAAQVACRALRAALAEPMTVLARASGRTPALVVAEAAMHGPAMTFDVVRDAWVDAWAAGLVDPASVLRGALESAVSMVGIAITTDVLVHHRRPEIAREP